MLPRALALHTAGPYMLAHPNYLRAADRIELSLSKLSAMEQHTANGEVLGVSLVLEEVQDQAVSGPGGNLAAILAGHGRTGPGEGGSLPSFTCASDCQGNVHGGALCTPLAICASGAAAGAAASCVGRVGPRA